MKKRSKATWFLMGVLVAVLTIGMLSPAVAALVNKAITVQTGAKLVVDGAPFEPTDVNGNKVETFSYNGTIYVPIRAIATLFEKEVWWNQNELTAYIGRGDTEVMYLLEVCPPYEKDQFHPEDSFMMGEKLYTHGFYLGYSNFYASGMAMFNLGGKYDTLSFDVGHIDGRFDRTSSYQIYLDGVLVETIEVAPEMLPTHYEIPLNGAQQMKITGGEFSGCYALVDVTVS